MTGELMAREIAEQPRVLADLLARAGEFQQVARAIARRAPRFVLFAARGTSDHAALYAKYLTEIRLGLPAGLVSTSTMTLYGARPDLRDVLFVAVSQSGASPDLARVPDGRPRLRGAHRRRHQRRRLRPGQGRGVPGAARRGRGTCRRRDQDLHR